MPPLEISKDITTSFTGTILALISAGIIWFLKSLYEKYRNEKLALAKFERIFAINLTTLKDNFEFVDNWISALKNNCPYSFHLEKYFIDDETTFKLSNIELINSLISVNYMLRRAGSDLENIYKGYWEIVFKIDAISDLVQKEANLKQYHSTVINALEQIKKNYDPLNNKIMETVALLRAVDRTRFHSLFGYLGILFMDIFPRVTKKLKEAELVNLRKNIQMKRIIVVHGWGGYPEEGWFPSFKNALEVKGYSVLVPKMPHTENPTINDWVQFLSKIVGKPDENTYLVGHSIGCQTILRYLEGLNASEKIAGALFVAGWFNLENMDSDEEKEIAEPWLSTPINFARVRAALPKSTLIISDNDPYGAFEENKKKFAELGSKIIVLHNADRINGESHTSLPEALTELESL